MSLTGVWGLDGDCMSESLTITPTGIGDEHLSCKAEIVPNKDIAAFCTNYLGKNRSYDATIRFQILANEKYIQFIFATPYMLDNRVEYLSRCAE